jgi:serine/threonine protein kinase
MPDRRSPARAQRALVQASTGEARSRRAQARVGHTLCGKWRLDRLIGLGGVAAVYAATHKHGGSVAIKVLHSDLADVPEVRERFFEEAYIANRVGHPGAVAVRDESTTADGTIFLVMELLEGETLERRYSSGAGFTPGQVLEVANQILDVLIAAHDKGIIHRDIKPDNVLLTLDGSVKVLDFGVARVGDTGRAHTTEAGAIVGTPAFMPPEQARGHWDKLDGRADIWSLGATMYFMLTGRLVREADTPNEELLSAMTEPIPSIRTLRSVPRAVAEIVDRALAFNARDRYPNARSMQGAVQRALAAMQRSAFSEEAPLPSSAPRLFRGSPAFAAGGLVLALGVALSVVELATLLGRAGPLALEARGGGRSSLLSAELSHATVIAVETAELVELPPEVDQLTPSSSCALGATESEHPALEPGRVQ